jgi:hypothetical protein
VLWIQVVTQAKQDLEDEPGSSILYDHAVAFFVGSGQWAESCGVIADLLAMHPDDLFRSGQRWIAARRAAAGAAAAPRPSPPPLFLQVHNAEQNDTLEGAFRHRYSGLRPANDDEATATVGSSCN